MHAQRLAQFRADIQRARDLVGLGNAVGNLTSGVVDASDVYRAGLVQAVSAMDHYFHGVVLDRAVDIVLGRAQQGSASKVGLSFGAVQAVVTAPTSTDAELAARAYIAQRLSLETYQQPDDIAKAMSMVGVPALWGSAFPAPAPVKTALSLVVQRRNRIVHQCDADPLTPGQVTPITETDALVSIASVETAVRGLDPHL